MTPERSRARATDHTAGTANKMTPIIARLEAIRRGEPSARERMTSVTETKRVSTNRTAIV